MEHVVGDCIVCGGPVVATIRLAEKTISADLRCLHCELELFVDLDVGVCLREHGHLQSERAALTRRNRRLS